MNVTLDGNIGKTIGIYKVLDICERCTNDGHKLYRVECVFCGWQSDMKLSDVKYATKCTHLNKHGDYKNFNSFIWQNKRIGEIFEGMKSRCYNPERREYRWYGANGIKICDAWMENPKSFEDWALNNGYNDNLTIDRMDHSDDYCPENCRWITLESNSKYKSTTSLINVDGEVHTGRDWSKVLSLSPNVINKYIRVYGLENTINFIRKYKENPGLKPSGNQSYYSLYMEENIDLT